jgi:hypothetical protein
MVTAEVSLSRIRRWLAAKGCPVQGDMYLHALEELVKPKPDPEPTLDAGWPSPAPTLEKNR